MSHHSFIKARISTLPCIICALEKALWQKISLFICIVITLCVYLCVFVRNIKWVLVINLMACHHCISRARGFGHVQCSSFITSGCS